VKIRSLLGKAAVANSKIVYQEFKQIFGSAHFARLRANGAAVQRPLWGSTGTKNPAYSDLLYVDTLIGPHTVNTVPPATYAAILDHGKLEPTLEQDPEGSLALLREVTAVGVDMGLVMKKLEDDGVAAFEKSFDGLYRNLEQKRARFTQNSTGRERRTV
jgi:transaldolase